MILTTKINIENIRCMVDAAHHLQTAGEDKTAVDVLMKLAHSIIDETKKK